MGFFKRKKDEEAKIQLEREALDKLNGNDIDTFEIPEGSDSNDTLISDWQISGKTKAPHTITAEELNSKAQKSNNSSDGCSTEEIPMSKSEETNSSPTDFLFQKMMQSRAKMTENNIETAENTEHKEDIEDAKDNESIQNQQIPPSEHYVPIDIEAAIVDIKNHAKLNLNDATEARNYATSTEEAEAVSCNFQTTENIVTDKKEKATDEKALEKALILEDTQPTKKSDEITNMGTSAEERRATLLARCNAYLEDDSGPVKADTEKYKLESVESILEGFEARAAERVNKRFTVTSSPPATPPHNKPKTPPAATLQASSTDTTNDTVIFKVPTISNNDSKVTGSASDANRVKHIFTATEQKAKSTDIADNISSTQIITDISSHSKPIDVFSSDKTSVFPIVEPIIDTKTSDINDSESSGTEPHDEESLHMDDYCSIADRPKILNNLLRKKKNFTFKCLLTFLALIPSLLTLPPISNNLQLSANTVNIIDLLVCLFVAFVNLSILNCITSLFSQKAKLGLPASLSLLAAIIFSVINLIFKGDFVGFSSVTSLSALSYNLANRNFYSKTIKNFNIIANAEFKNAVSIIQNKNATKNIVDKAIDGSALVCYGGETTNIHSFLKYTYCRNPISDKIQKLSLIGVIIGFGLALASLVLNSGNAILSVYIFSATVCYSAIPAVYHIVSLTINCANKRLNHYDAMITGYRAADELELCNGIAISGNTLFPDGTIRLVDMKLLSPNPFDQSMLDAAAIATAIHSPIAGIFKQIDTSKTYTIPETEVDSVIYEEKMGISGWVNDRRVFVGNRDLLIAHGFSGLPPAELDKKIMRKGYFPIYIASDNIPCALLVVRYEPDEDIVYEMQRLANTGTTIIIDNCDPNINAKMLSDYFKLYDDSVFVMSKRGSDFYRALIPHKEHRRAGVAYKTRIEGLLASLTASINIKKRISRMTVFYICSIILGLLGLTACLFASLNNFITPLNILILQLLMTAITLLPTVLRKP